MATTKREPIEGVRIIDAAEAREVFDYQARKLVGMSGEEFLRRWDAGEYRNIPDTPEGRRTMEVIFLLPFVRRIT